MGLIQLGHIDVFKRNLQTGEWEMGLFVGRPFRLDSIRSRYPDNRCVEGACKRDPTRMLFTPHMTTTRRTKTKAVKRCCYVTIKPNNTTDGPGRHC